MNVHQNERIVSEIQQFIMDHIHISLTASHLAQRFGYSVMQFNRIVKTVTGISPSQYIRTIKLDQGKQWLKDSEMTVTEIANALGYEYENHFSRMFQNSVGIKPVTYRKVQQEKDRNW